MPEADVAQGELVILDCAQEISTFCAAMLCAQWSVMDRMSWSSHDIYIWLACTMTGT